ncbi:MAG: SRPBCC family protein [Actinomycetota bacterium]
MIRITESAIIHRSPEDIFDLAADPVRQLEWDPKTLRSVEKLTPGPLDRGARYRGSFKGYGTVEYDFVEYDPPRAFAHHATMKMGEMKHTFTLEPVPEGTRLTQVGELQPNLLGRIMSPMLRSGLKKRFRRIASELDEFTAS